MEKMQIKPKVNNNERTTDFFKKNYEDIKVYKL